jgi:hypothetical protein
MVYAHASIPLRWHFWFSHAGISESCVTSPKQKRNTEMGKTIITLIIGLVIGGMGGLVFGGGVGAGAGIATGLSAGICSTVTAAEELGIMTAEQVDEVLTKAALDATGQASLTDDQKIVGSKAQCDEFMATLRASK